MGQGLNTGMEQNSDKPWSQCVHTVWWTKLKEKIDLCLGVPGEELAGGGALAVGLTLVEGGGWIGGSLHEESIALYTAWQKMGEKIAWDSLFFMQFLGSEIIKLR